MIGQYFNPALWGHGLQASVAAPGHPAFWLAVLQIVLINTLLSGDNAVVIAMVCRGLPPRQRFWGMMIGAGLAALLLIVFTGLVARLIELPYFKLIGGVALFYIAAKLLVPGGPGRHEVTAAVHLWRVVRVVAVADIVMGLDNILAVAAVAHGDVVLLLIGLGVSIPIVLAGATFVMMLLDRFPALVWVGAALLGWIAGKMIATDGAVSGHLADVLGDGASHRIETAAGAAGVVLVIGLGGFFRWASRSRFRAGPVEEKSPDA